MYKSHIWYNLLNSECGWLLSDPYYESFAKSIINGGDYLSLDKEIELMMDELLEVTQNISNIYSKAWMVTPDDIHLSIPAFHISQNLYSLKKELLKYIQSQG